MPCRRICGCCVIATLLKTGGNFSLILRQNELANRIGVQRFGQFLNTGIVNVIRARDEVFDIQAFAFLDDQRFIGINTGLPAGES